MSSDCFLECVWSLYGVLGKQNPYCNWKRVFASELFWHLCQTVNRKDILASHEGIVSKGFGNLARVLESTKPHNIPLKVLGGKCIPVAFTEFLLPTPLLCNFIQHSFIKHLDKLWVDLGSDVIPTHRGSLGESDARSGEWVKYDITFISCYL